MIACSLIALGAANIGTPMVVEQDTRAMPSFAILANRSAEAPGEQVTIEFVVGHVGDDFVNYDTPSAVWLKDGVPFREIGVTTPESVNGRARSKLSFIFQNSDAGEYQCVFTDLSPIEAVYATAALRLDSNGDKKILFFLT